jgi:hypothetical protein
MSLPARAGFSTIRPHIVGSSPCRPNLVPRTKRMSPTRANLISVAMGCTFALVQGGCATSLTPPFAAHEVSKNTAAIAATPPSPVTSSIFPAPDSTQPDMTVVLDKLQQVRSIDPMAEQRLLDELHKVPPTTWPLVAEQFRASLAYHEQLAEKNRPGSRDNQPVVDLRRAPLTNPKQFVAANVTYDESLASNDDRPSAPIGSLVDPHGVNSESSPVLARKKPHSLPSPIGDVADSAFDPKAPAQFSSDGPAYPIGDRNVAAADGQARDTAAAETQHVASQAYGQATGTPAAKQTTAVEVGDRDRAVRLPDTRSANDPNWQLSIQKAIADLEHRVSPSPTTTAEVHQHVSLRILRLLSGDTEKALEPIPHISPSEQDYWSRQLFALATYLDHHSQPDDKRRAAATVTHLDEAVSSLRELGSLSLHNMSFCKTVYGYGAFEPYESDTFSPGQHVSIYVEVENYHSTSNEKGFNTSLGTSYEVLDDHGKRVTSGDFPDVNDCCRSRRRDFHLQLGLKLPDNIAAGRYQVQLLVKDRQSDKIGNAKASFEVRAGKKK